MLFADIHLARRLELTNTLECVEYARAHARLFPDSGSLSIPLMGGFATYAGADSPITQAFGLGLQGVVSESEVDELEDFYFSRRVAVNIELCPLADVTLIEILMRRGYRIIETSNVLYQELNTFRSAQSAQATVRIPGPDEEEKWAKTIARGFVEDEEPHPIMIELGRTIFQSENSVPFLVEVEGQPAGGGGVSISNGVADFYGQATIPAFRRRGVQSALIQASLSYAKEQGCEIAMGTTMCGTTSQHNFERNGFRICYSRIKLMREWPGE
ncbi:MAG: GNAT family N-acetyltransferase [Acidobacteria bacterium]|nr:GNAT family N-acetyltransferase [Acidobacteriota bacterium]